MRFFAPEVQKHELWELYFQYKVQKVNPSASFVHLQKSDKFVRIARIISPTTTRVARRRRRNNPRCSSSSIPRPWWA